MEMLEQIKSAVVKGHQDAQAAYPPELKGKPGVKELTEEAIEEGLPVADILKRALIAGMEIVGEKFSTGEYFVPDMLLSARAMKVGLKLLEPHLTAAESQKSGQVILGTVAGDLHDIGKNLVAMMLEGGGFEVIDLGVDTPVEKFVEQARENPQAIIGLSALLTTTMTNMKTTIEGLRSAGLDNRVIIGGAATSQSFADEIKADGYSRDASGAVPLVKRLLNG